MTVEHAYQSHKTLDESVRETIRNANDPAVAKKLGRGIILRPDWDIVKESLMRDFLQKKFESPFLAYLLQATGDALLIHGNSWNDRVWGVCRGRGDNLLGKILMDIRGSLNLI